MSNLEDLNYSDSYTKGGVAAQDVITEVVNTTTAEGTKPIGPSPDNAPFITNAEYEAQDRKRFNDINTLVKATDTHALNLLNQINTKKDEIVAKIAEAFANIDDPNITNYLIGSEWSNHTDALLADTASVALSDSGWLVAIARNFSLINYAPYYIDILDGDTMETDTVYLTGVEATVFYDYIAIYKYPVLEREDHTADTYRDGSEGWKLLSTKGQGEIAKVYHDQNYDPDIEGEISEAPPGPAGTIKCWQNKNKMNNALSGSGDYVQDRIDDIITLRQELYNYIEAESTGSNPLRASRHYHLRELWFELVSQNAEVSLAIEDGELFDILNDPEKREDILTYDGD
ncbi:MAG: hypothetical protein CBD74_09755 [Saprospirales bacterium TMED214]|nr:MAG: hypothetical protein CBD74_09755 [Saprospirales bacterium TMED214]